MKKTLLFTLISVPLAHTMQQACLEVAEDSNSKATSELIDLLKGCDSYNHHRAVQLIENENADVNAKDTLLNNWTPLHHATKRRNVEACTLLLQCGANPNSRSTQKETPLDIASTRSIAELLLAHGAKINSKDRNGETALFKAAKTCDIKRCIMLLDVGAEISSENNREETPSMVAIEECSLKLTDLQLHQACYENEQKRAQKQEFPVAFIQTFNNTSRLYRCRDDAQRCQATVKLLLTESLIDDVRSQTTDSFERINTFLLCARRVCPTLPKEIRLLILCSNEDLLKDISHLVHLGIIDKKTIDYRFRVYLSPYTPSEKLTEKILETKKKTNPRLLGIPTLDELYKEHLSCTDKTFILHQLKKLSQTIRNSYNVVEKKKKHTTKNTHKHYYTTTLIYTGTALGILALLYNYLN